MKLERKLIIALTTIAAFTAVLIVKEYDPLALGAGFATFLATVMYGFGAEYKNKVK